MITVKLEKDEQPDVLTKANKVEYIMVLTRILEPNVMVDTKMVELAQEKIKELIKEI